MRNRRYFFSVVVPLTEFSPYSDSLSKSGICEKRVQAEINDKPHIFVIDF